MPVFKVPYSSKLDMFDQKMLNKLMYGINTIIKCGIWQPVKFQLVSHLWTGSINVGNIYLSDMIQNCFVFYPILG